MPQAYIIISSVRKFGYGARGNQGGIMKHTEVSADVKKPDRRVIKTKRAIRNAFAALMAEKDLNDITIKDISDVADINRKTVYNYYGGIHEILDEIENELVSSFEKVIQEIDFPAIWRIPTKFSKR